MEDVIWSFYWLSAEFVYSPTYFCLRDIKVASGGCHALLQNAINSTSSELCAPVNLWLQILLCRDTKHEGQNNEKGDQEASLIGADIQNSG